MKCFNHFLMQMGIRGKFVSALNAWSEIPELDGTKNNHVNDQLEPLSTFSFFFFIEKRRMPLLLCGGDGIGDRILRYILMFNRFNQSVSD